MTQSNMEAEASGFNLWYRFRAVMVFSLLQVGGPAHLEAHNDPRAEVEQEYVRRRALDRQRKGKAPIVEQQKSNGTGMLSVALPIAGGLVAVLILIAWAVVSAH